MREAVLGQLRRDRPPRAVHVLPAHGQDFAAALGRHEHQPEGVGDDPWLGVAARPDGADLVLGQDAIALRLGARLREAHARARLDQILADRPGVEAACDLEDSVRHDRRPVGEAIDEGAHLATFDLLGLQVAEGGYDLVRNQEVAGSIPARSTNLNTRNQGELPRPRFSAGFRLTVGMRSGRATPHDPATHPSPGRQVCPSTVSRRFVGLRTSAGMAAPDGAGWPPNRPCCCLRSPSPMRWTGCPYRTSEHPARG